MNAVVWIPDSKTPNGVAEVPLTEIAAEPSGIRWRSRVQDRGCSQATRIQSGIRRPSRRSGTRPSKRAKIPYFRIYDLRSTYATRLSAGGVADEWVTQLLRQGDAKVFKKYSQMKLQMKREALEKLNRQANEERKGFGTVWCSRKGFWYSFGYSFGLER